MYQPAIVYTSYVYHLPAPSACDVFWQSLIGESLECRLDNIHLVPRARRPCGEVTDTGSSCELEDEVLTAVAEA